jgi:hypothetical protein
MSQTMADLIVAYEAAQNDYEHADEMSRDWSGPFPGRDKDLAAFVSAAEAAQLRLMAALGEHGPVVYAGRDYRVVQVPDGRHVLQIGRIAQPAEQVIVTTGTAG